MKLPSKLFCSSARTKIVKSATIKKSLKTEFAQNVLKDLA